MGIAPTQITWSKNTKLPPNSLFLCLIIKTQTYFSRFTPFPKILIILLYFLFYQHSYSVLFVQNIRNSNVSLQMMLMKRGKLKFVPVADWKFNVRTYEWWKVCCFNFCTVLCMEIISLSSLLVVWMVLEQITQYQLVLLFHLYS